MKLLYGLNAIFLIVLSSCGEGRESTEAELVDLFVRNTARFNSVKKMALLDVKECKAKLGQEKCSIRVEVDSSGKIVSLQPENMFPLDRIYAYSSKVAEIGLPETLITAGDDWVSIVAYRRGLSVSGSLKSFDWMLKEPSPIYPSLDTEWELNNNGSFKYGYRKLGDDWYLSVCSKKS